MEIAKSLAYTIGYQLGHAVFYLLPTIIMIALISIFISRLSRK